MARNRVGSVDGGEAQIGDMGFCSAADVLCRRLTPQGGGAEVGSSEIWLMPVQWCFGFGLSVGGGFVSGYLSGWVFWQLQFAVFRWVRRLCLPMGRISCNRLDCEHSQPTLNSRSSMSSSSNTQTSTAFSLASPSPTVQVKLDNHNYPSRLSQFMPILHTHEFTGIVDGSEPCPPKFVSDAEANRFASQSKSRITQLKRQLQTIRQDTKTCAEYLQLAKGFADQLAIVGNPIDDADLISFLIGGLNSSFNPFITSYSLATRDNSMKFDDFRDELLNHETLLQQQTSAADSATFALFSNKSAGNQNVGNWQHKNKPPQHMKFSPRAPHPTLSPRQHSYSMAPRSNNFYPKQQHSYSPDLSHSTLPCRWTATEDHTRPQIVSKTFRAKTSVLPFLVLQAQLVMLLSQPLSSQQQQAIMPNMWKNQSHNTGLFPPYGLFLPRQAHPPPQLAAMVAQTNATIEDQPWYADRYKCLDPITNKVYLSRHVVFDENAFPAKETLAQLLPSKLAAQDDPHSYHTILSEKEPTSFTKATTNSRWREAMLQEFQALVSNGTWTLCPRPLHHNIVRNKWVYKIKQKPDGSVERFKAGLVARGFEQRCGIDYNETFSPVIKPSTIQIILSLAIQFDWSIHQLDISNAFLHGYLGEEVFMEQPQGFVDKAHPDYVCSHAATIQSLISTLQQEFPLKDLGPLGFFLGIEATRIAAGLHLCQAKYISDLLHRVQMQGAKPSTSPCSSSTKLSKFDGVPLSDPSEYSHVVGSLQYCTLTRPEIAFVVNQLCQHLQTPTTAHWTAAKRVLRPRTLSAYCDADWAGSPDDRRSTSGSTIFLSNCLVAWSAKKQAIVSWSSTEAEYRALALTTADLFWIRMLFKDLGISIPSVPTLCCDNVSAIALASNPVFHARTKHIEVDYHLVHEKVVNRDISVKFISSGDQLADVFTKGLTSAQFLFFKSKLIVVPPISLRGAVRLHAPAVPNPTVDALPAPDVAGSPHSNEDKSP
ncbi:uncharacterized protein LOC133879040 [Alnus glutinosa]|uniref:uncharacterized protein LOC133879040 n=1 Tax=Alnus glutinosa TaxID=3517 RepID=UPI002D77859A|nr:uncharacterized protein LOC133879040 [Alnus glutinosa]